MTTLLLSDLTEGGAAIACRRLFQALRGESRDVQWLAAEGNERSGATVAAQWADLPALIASRVVRRITPNQAKHRAAERFLHEQTLRRAVRRLAPSVINVHNLHAVAGFRLMERLPQAVPLVWTLHDMWALTGGCFYSYDCNKYLTGECDGSCLRDGDSPDPARFRAEWQRRTRFVVRRSGRLALVTPSRWLKACAEKRFGDSVRVECIPNSVDLDVFAPEGERGRARQALDLPADRPILLTGSHFLGDRRKGMGTLISALAQLSPDLRGRVLMLSLGDGALPADLPVDWRGTGLIRDEALLNLYYNAADLHVLPTLADNLPNTLLESLAAGTPSVVSDVGGCSEALIDGETGLLIPPGDAHALASGLERMLSLDDEAKQRFRHRCRGKAEQEFTPQRQATAYQRLFDALENQQ